MYATSSANDSSSLADAYFVALCQNTPVLEDFSIILCSVNNMTHRMIEKSSNTGVFWHNATKYASASDDESFAEEVAYMMVTLHRTGA
jgi:hypothetical protein